MYVVVSRYAPEKKAPIVHTWGPFDTKGQAINCKRRHQRRNQDDPRNKDLRYHICLVLGDL